MTRYLGYQANYYDYRLVEKDCCGCSSYDYKPWANWLLRKDVTEALHVCGDAGAKAFGNCAAGCISLPDFDKDDTFDYSGAVGEALKQGIRVTFYYGMQDTACNYVGGYHMAEALQWPGASEFSSVPFEDLIIGGVTSGKIKSARGLTFMQVENAGHMVPINSPAAADIAIGTLIRRGSRADSCASGPSRPNGDADDDDSGDGLRYLQHLRRLYTRGHDAEGTNLRLSEVALAVASAGLVVATVAFFFRWEVRKKAAGRVANTLSLSRTRTCSATSQDGLLLLTLD
jgi:hypothetical protein